MYGVQLKLLQCDRRLPQYKSLTTLSTSPSLKGGFLLSTTSKSCTIIFQYLIAKRCLDWILVPPVQQCRSLKRLWAQILPLRLKSCPRSTLDDSSQSCSEHLPEVRGQQIPVVSCARDVNTGSSITSFDVYLYVKHFIAAFTQTCLFLRLLYEAVRLCYTSACFFKEGSYGKKIPIAA
jgi:hypothetical protein